MSGVNGTRGYAEEAASLLVQYERPAFTAVHAHILHVIPPPPSRVLDIGAGTGRDAAALAALGHSVVAVEPTAALREPAKALHPSPLVEWIDDALPELSSLTGRAGSFDMVLLSAVWMHLDADQRRRAMPAVARLLALDGVLILSLRHGPVPEGRRMFEVTGDETAALAAAEDLDLLLRLENLDSFFKRPGISWTRLVFHRSARRKA